MTQSCTRETDLTNLSKIGLTGEKFIGKSRTVHINCFSFRHSSIFLTDDEKDGKTGHGDDEMPELPDQIDSFQDENMEDAISSKKEDEEEATNAKDEL